MFRNHNKNHFNFEFEVEVEIEKPHHEYEVEIEVDYPHHDKGFAYGGGHGGNNHYQNEVEIEIEVDANFNWNNHQQWGKRNHEWEVPWTGWYKQGMQKHDMNFNNFQCNNQGQIWGHGSDENGTFNISGKCDFSHTGFTFHKQYHGAHTVIYKGRIQNGNLWVGKWEIPGNCEGKFQIRCKAQKWKGAFWQGNQKNVMQLDMQVNKSGVYGNGHDDVGGFIIRGDVHGSQCNFYKQYYGAHTVLYHGQMNPAHTDIRGNWQILNNCGGKFHLHL